MRVKTYIALTSEIRINTQFENTFTNFIKTDITTKRLVLLPVDWDKKGYYLQSGSIGQIRLLVIHRQEPL